MEIVLLVLSGLLNLVLIPGTIYVIKLVIATNLLKDQVKSLPEQMKLMVETTINRAFSAMTDRLEKLESDVKDLKAHKTQIQGELLLIRKHLRIYDKE